MIIAVAVVAAAVLVLLLLRSEPTRPQADATVKVFKVGGVPRSLLLTDDALWVGTGTRTLLEVDPTDGSVEKKIDLAFVPGDMIEIGDSIYLGAIEGTSIARVGQSSDEPEYLDNQGQTPQSLALGAGWLWIAAFDDGAVHRLELDGNLRRETVFKEKNAFPSGLAFFGDSLWVTDVVDDVVMRLDVDGNVTDEIVVGDGPTTVVGGAGSVWVAEFNDRSVARIDPETGTSQSILVGGKPTGIAVDDEFVWVTRAASDDIVRIDVSSGRWTGEVFEVGDSPQDIVLDGESIWVANQADGMLSRMTVED